MEYITLKNSDLRVSRLCMGGCPMGGYGWGEVQEKELIDAVHAALDTGVCFFDTADTYGLGQSERTLGKALRGRRGDAVIATKFGVRAGEGPTYYDNSPAWMRRALEASLQRLGTDYVDLYQLHYRDGKTPIAEVVGALEELKKEGKLRFYGLSNIHGDDIPELAPHIGRFVSFQDEYSLACRKNEQDLLTISEKLQMTPLTWGSLGQGILTGKYTRENINFGADDRRSREIYVNFHGKRLTKNLLIVEYMRGIASRGGKSETAVAIRFILDKIPDSVVLCGAKRPAQVESQAAGLDWHLTREELQLLEEISA